MRTTTLLLDDDILIDAGTGMGMGDLSLDAMQKINTVFLTHSHLDHICSIAFLLDAVGVDRQSPLQVFGLKKPSRLSRPTSLVITCGRGL